MTKTRVETRRVCPAELDQARPLKPAVPPGARVTGNALGLDWLASLAAWGDAVARLFDDAKATCAADTGAGR